MIELVPLLIAVAFGSAAIGFFWIGVSGYVTQNGRLARRLYGEVAQKSLARGSTEERLVSEDDRLSALERFLTPSDEERASKIRTRLFRAGYRNAGAVRVYFAVKWGVALAGFLLGALIFAAVMDPAQPLPAVAMMLMVVALSFFGTDMWIERRIAYRKIDIERAFPDALDLMLVCIEAGHGLDQAIGRVASEISRSAKILSDELQLVVGQLRAGKERDRVLADFSDRCGVDDVGAFVTVMKQADKFGVSIADTLRVYAAEMRNKRYMRAEEKANMMPVKLALGAIMFTVPPTIIVLIGPSIIMIVREMAKAASVAG
ncbi:MAG: type II secretion system F family protein [Amphiplicatus sp.]